MCLYLLLRSKLFSVTIKVKDAKFSRSVKTKKKAERGERRKKEYAVHIWEGLRYIHIFVSPFQEEHRGEEVRNPDERIRYAYRFTESSPFRRNRHLMLVHSLWMNVERYIEISGKSTYQPIKLDQIKKNELVGQPVTRSLQRFVSSSIFCHRSRENVIFVATIPMWRLTWIFITLVAFVIHSTR